MSKVINTILTLRDQLSGPMQNASKAAKRAGEMIGGTKKELKQHEEQQVKNSEAVSAAKLKVAQLTETFGENSKEVLQAKLELERHQQALKKSNEQVKEASSKVKEYQSTIRSSSKHLAEAQKRVDKFGKKTIESMDKLISRTVKWGAAISTAVAGFALKTGFTEAFDMEGYKTQLVTAVKDTEKAGELMANAVKVANSTPFETGSVVQATASLEALGVSSRKWLVDIADMAGGTNKGIDQATEATIKAIRGEFQSMEAFGIQKSDVMLAAEKKFGKNVVFNKKGQVQDMKKLEETLQEYMQSKFKGGAEAQSRTVRGLWSTVTGVTKSSLAKIVGMQEDGTIKQGSLLELLKEKIIIIVELLNKWMEDGTISRIADQVTTAVGIMLTFFKELFDFIYKWRQVIEVVIVFVGTIYTAVKAFYFLKTAMIVINTVMMLLNGTLLISPLGWFALALGAVAGVVYLVWRNFDSLVSMFKNAWQWIKNLASNMDGFTISLLGPLAPILLLIKHFDKLKEVAGKAWGWVKKFFGGSEESGVNLTQEEKRSDKYGTSSNRFPTIPPVKAPNPSATGAGGGGFMRSQTVEKKTEININIDGDTYGFPDFQEKVCEAVTKAYNQNSANVVGG